MNETFLKAAWVFSLLLFAAAPVVGEMVPHGAQGDGGRRAVDTDDLTQKSVTELVAQLEALTYREREGANRELTKRGRRIARELLLARQNAVDPEVKKRLAAIIGRVHTDIIGPIELSKSIASEIFRNPEVKEMCRAVRAITKKAETLELRAMGKLKATLRTFIETKLPELSIPTAPAVDEAETGRREKLIKEWESFNEEFKKHVEAEGDLYEPYIPPSYNLIRKDVDAVLEPRKVFQEQGMFSAALTIAIVPTMLKMTSREFYLEKDGKNYLLSVNNQSPSLSMMKQGMTDSWDPKTKTSRVRSISIDPSRQFSSNNAAEYLLAGTDRAVTKDKLKETIGPRDISVAVIWKDNACVLSPADPGYRSREMGASLVKDFYEDLLKIDFVEAGKIIEAHEPHISKAFHIPSSEF
jgi:hypothetical protein